MKKILALFGLILLGILAWEALPSTAQSTGSIQLGKGYSYGINTPYFTWSYSETAPHEMEIERSTDGGLSWTHLTTIGSLSRSHRDNEVLCGIAYQYRLRIHRLNDNSYSAYSNVISYNASPCASALSNNICSFSLFLNVNLQTFDGVLLSGDSSRVFLKQYNDDTAQHWLDIYETSSSTLIQTINDVEPIEASNNGSRFIYIVRDDSTWTNRLQLWDNGSVTTIAEMMFVGEASISGDGSKVVFIGVTALGASRKVYLWQDGLGYSEINTGFTYPQLVKISGDGETVVVEGSNPNSYSTMISRWNALDGVEYLGEIPVAENIDYYYYQQALEISVSEDGSAVSVSYLYDGHDSQYHVIYSWRETEGFVALNSYPEFNWNQYEEVNIIPSIWSADGSRLLFLIDDDLTGENPDESLEYFVRDGAIIRQITTNARNGIPFEPMAMSDDGTKILAITALPAPVDSAMDALSEFGLAMGTCSAPSAFIPLNPVSDLSAANGSSQVDLSWTDNNSDETSYFVEIFTGYAWVDIAEVPASSTSYSYSDIFCGQNYQFRIRAHRDSDGAYAYYSNVANVSTPACESLSAPTNARLVNLAEGSMELSWTDRADGETSYIIERAAYTTVGGTSTSTSSTSSTTSSTASSTTGTSGATGSSGTSTSGSTSATSGATSTSSTTTMGSAGSSTVDGSARTGSGGSVNVQWGTDSAGSWHVVGEIGANSTSFVDNVRCGTLYFYRVRAYRESDDSYSPYTSSYGIYSIACSDFGVRNVQIVDVTSSSMSLEWEIYGTNITRIHIERGSGVAVWTEIAQLVPGSTNYVDTGVFCDRSYNYRIRVYRSVDNRYTGYVYPSTNLFTEACTAEGAPSNLFMSANSTNSISLSWTDNSSDETGFVVERQLAGDGLQSWTTVGTAAPNSTSFTDNSTLSCVNAYRYRLVAIRANNYTQSSNFAIGYWQCPAPNAPTLLQLSERQSSYINLTWNANDNYSYGIVERSTDAGLSWTEVMRYGNYTASSFYHDTDVSCATSYQYRVRNYRPRDESYSAYSNVFSTSTLGCAGFNAPSSLSMNSNSANSIELAWLDTNSDETGFALEISSDAVSWLTVTSLPADSTSYTVTGLLCAREYHFRIQAVKGTLYSPYSTELQAIAGACPALNAPSNLVVSASHSHGLTLNWTDNESDESAYLLERSLDGVSWEEVGQAQANVATYQDIWLNCNSVYHHRVRAYRSYDASYSEYSNVVTGTTSACLLSSPLVLSVSETTTTSVSLSWVDTSTGETSFWVEHSYDQSSWYFNQWVSANSTAYTWSGITCNKTMYFRIWAHRSADNSFSPVSNVATANCPAPNAPSNFRATALNYHQILLQWTDNSNSESNFKIEYLSEYGWSTGYWTTSANATSVVISGNPCNTEHIYRIRAYRSTDGVYSSYSTEVSVTTKQCNLNTPSGLTVEEVSGNSISLVWVDTNTTESGYYVERSANGTSGWTNVATLGQDASAYIDTGLGCGWFYYRVRAYRTSDSATTSYSNTAFGFVECPALTAPSGLMANAIGMAVDLSWIDLNDTETNFRLEESSNGGTSWTEIAQPRSSVYSRMMTLCGTTYQYRVRTYRAGDNTFSNYSNVVAVQSAACPPAAPTGLAIIETSAGNITLSWTDNATDETSYRIERSTNTGSSFSEIANIAADSTGYDDTGHICNQYRYRVRAYRAGDNQYSSYSSVVYLTCPAPGTPTNLIQSGSTSSSITISWTDNATDETSYRVERSTNGGTTWSQLATLAANSTSHPNSSLSCNTSYQYRVRAHRSSDGVFSAYSDVLTASTLPCPPTAPSSLTITDNSGGSVSLNWLDNASTETGYRLERSTNSGSTWTEIAQLAAGTTSYNDTGVLCSQYRYRVRAVNDTIFSGYSNVAYLTCPPPAAPTNANISLTSMRWVNVTWTDNASDETSYIVQRSINGGSTWSNLVTLSSNMTQWGDNQVACNTTYHYRVRAFRSSDGVYSDFSNVVSTTTSACLPEPNPLTGSAQSSTSITINWSDNASNETAYQIYRTDAQFFSLVATVGANTTSYQDNNLRCNTTYRYRIRAYRASDNEYSPYTNEISVTTGICVTLLAPTGFTLSSRSTSSLNFSWVDNSTNESGYELERSLDGTNWQVLASLPANSTSYSDSLLECQTGYHYRLRALHLGNGTYGVYGRSPLYQTQTCPPLVASTLSSTGSTSNSIALSWTVDATANSFTLSYSQAGGWVNLGTFGRNLSSFTHNGLSCGQTYQYRVQVSRQADSATVYSNTFSASTSACAVLGSPAAPTVLNADVSLVSLQIPAMPAGASSMSLERSTDGINWFGLGLASMNYLDTTVICGTSYQYRLVAYRASDGQYSAPSPVAHATTLACPVAVSNVVGVYRNGQWVFADSNNTAVPSSSFSFGDNSWQALVGDWDGDGVDGLGLYRNGEFILRNNTAGTLSESRFNFGDAIAGWQAVSGDWNGDGIDSIGLYKDGLFILSDDNLNQTYRFNFGDGAAGWIVVAGDWDGNGADGIGLYKNGLWYLADSALNAAGTMQSIAYGPNQAGWLPVAGDWNGDGIDTIGLYKDGLWRLRLSSNTGGNEVSLFFGQAGDMPVAIYEGDVAGLSAFGMVIESPVIVPEITPEVTETP